MTNKGQYRVQQEDVCTKCGDYLLREDRPLVIVVESGVMNPMKKDPSFLRFVPDYLNSNISIADDAFTDIFHADCLLEHIQGSWGKFSPAQCDACEDRFLKDVPREAYRLRLGQIDFRTSAFLADDDPSNGAILCPYCFDYHVGDGQTEEFPSASNQ